MELDLRGSEVDMADSLGIKLIKDAAQESGESRRSPGVVRHPELSINSNAFAEDNPPRFQPMTEDMEYEFTRQEAEAWLRTLTVR